MKKIEVVAAILQRDGAYFATQRGYGEFEGMWEFPGGKIEPDENPEDAIKREIQEELGIDITIDKFLCTTEYDYPSFHLTMHCYLCGIETGKSSCENISLHNGLQKNCLIVWSGYLQIKRSSKILKYIINT